MAFMSSRAPGTVFPTRRGNRCRMVRQDGRVVPACNCLCHIPTKKPSKRCGSVCGFGGGQTLMLPMR